MNQYIITEEKLVKLQGYFHEQNLVKFFEIINEVFDHPYQSEREKVLDLITTFRKEQSKELKIHDMWVAEAEYLKELRQAGSP